MTASTLIKTERLSLRVMQSTDSDFIIELLNEPDFIEHIGDKQVRTFEEAINYMTTGPLACQKENGFSLLVVSLASGQPIGLCGLLKRETLPAPDLGYAFLARFYRQGYAYEACNAVLQHFNTIRPLYAITSLNNEASKHLLIKLGFLLDDTVQQLTDNVPITQFIKRQ